MGSSFFGLAVETFFLDLAYMDWLDPLWGFLNPFVILGVVLPLAILQVALLIVAVVNLMKKPVPSNDKIPWLLLIVFVNIIGPIIYFAIGSGKLDDKAAQLLDERERRG